jgi:hypothetical protein
VLLLQSPLESAERLSGLLAAVADRRGSHVAMAVSRRTNSMNARAAGEALGSRRRHTSTTGRWTAGWEASHLERGSLQGGERMREDRGGEPARGERAQEERVAAFEGEAERLTAGGE